MSVNTYRTDEVHLDEPNWGIAEIVAELRNPARGVFGGPASRR